MKLSLKILAIATIAASTYSLTGCAGPPSFSYQNVGITMTAKCADCVGAGISVLYSSQQPGVVLMASGGEGGTTEFIASVTDAPANVTWAIYPTPNLGTPNPPPTGSSTPVVESSSSVGLLNAASGSTAYYSTNGVPFYTGAALVQAQNMQYTITSPTGVQTPMVGIPQGDVLLRATVPSNPDDPTAVATYDQLIQVFNSNLPSVPSTYLTPREPSQPGGLTEPVVTVARGTSYQFYGGTYGAAPTCTTSSTCATDNTSIWEVGSSPATAVAGGSATYGTITDTGLYTAPATIPAGPIEVIIASHKTTTVYSYAYIAVD